MNNMIRINLLPEKAKLKLPKIPIGSILAVLIALGTIYALFYPVSENLNSELKKLEKRESDLKKDKKNKIAKLEDERNNLRKEIADKKRMINMVKSIITGENYEASTKVLMALTEVTKFKKGSGVWLTKFSMSKDFRANISGVAENDWVVVSNFIEKLKENRFFTEVTLDTAVKSFMDDGTKNVPVYNFEIVCRIDKTLAEQ